MNRQDLNADFRVEKVLVMNALCALEATMMTWTRMVLCCVSGSSAQITNARSGCTKIV